jgi:cysteine synthase B
VTVLAAIGNTPIARLQRLAPENGAELWVKLEDANPSG